MKTKLLLITLLALLSCTMAATASTPKLEASITPAKAVPGEQITYTVTFTSDLKTRARKITPPDWNGLELVNTTQSASTTRGKNPERKIIWKYSLKAPQKGRFTLSGATLAISSAGSENSSTIHVPEQKIEVTGLLLRHIRSLAITAIFLLAVLCAIPVLKLINRKNKLARKKQKEHNKTHHLQQEIDKTQQDVETLFVKRQSISSKEFFKQLSLRFDVYEEQITHIEERPAKSDLELAELVKNINRLKEEINYMGQQPDPSKIDILQKQIKRYFQSRLDQLADQAMPDEDN